MGARSTIEERFWVKVDTSGGNDACWLWTAAKIPGGFGSFTAPEENLAHRYSWFLHHGPIERGMFVIQICENSSCVNPRHLELSAEKCKKVDPAVRFWVKVDRAGPDDCWFWTKACNKQGYGTFNSGDGVIGAHRWSWESVNGPVPENLVLDHLCRVHNCVNPGHLEPATQAVNVERAVPFGVYGSANRRKTHCPQGHLYDDENTYVSKAGSRHCQVCIKERLRRSREDPEFRRWGQESQRRTNRRPRNERRSYVRRKGKPFTETGTS
ncbi:HNH endonuclease [Arthrobacter sp. efr-133-TYG-118]|uniref:HNH endonuclease signature motif containing protein n=1 Tax=Arthrobacter sp. efr-133-TYG-118 TaxID=3040279 RepID=UPI0033061513